MKIINLELIDTFTLSQEDYAHLPIKDRKAAAFDVCVRQTMISDRVSYTVAHKIVEDSLTFLKVQYS